MSSQSLPKPPLARYIFSRQQGQTSEMPEYPSDDGKYPSQPITQEPGSPVDLFCVALLQLISSSQAAHLRRTDQTLQAHQRARPRLNLPRVLSRRFLQSKNGRLSTLGSVRRWLYCCIRQRGMELLRTEFEKFLHQSSGLELASNPKSSKYLHFCRTLKVLAQIAAAGVNEANSAKGNLELQRHRRSRAPSPETVDTSTTANCPPRREESSKPYIGSGTECDPVRRRMDSQ